jgi:hypothetical protein
MWTGFVSLSSAAVYELTSIDAQDFSTNYRDKVQAMINHQRQRLIVNLNDLRSFAEAQNKYFR